jgi:FkbM family methyltransferase
MTTDFIEKIQFAYNSLSDDKSKEIFINRLLWNITDEYEFIEKIALKEGNKIPTGWVLFSNDFKTALLNKVKHCGNTLCIYGAGLAGQKIAHLLLKNGIRAKYFWDCKTVKVNLSGIPLPVYEPLSDYNNETVIIGSSRFSEEMVALLRQNGIPEEKIIIPEYTEKFIYDYENQYFDESIISFQESEVFVDAGSFDFGNSMQLLKKAGSKVEKIYAFEPDSENFRKIETIVKTMGLENVTLVNAGLWSEKTTLNFKANMGAGCMFDENGDAGVATESLDGMNIPEKITFIKMDIEGAELEALKGAQNIIRKDKPKLAICVYHKPEDIINIPVYVKKLVPDYKLYMRHYSDADLETVLYAVYSEDMV